MSWLDREVASQLVIIIAVAVGAWVMFVQPKAEELAELNETIADAAPAMDEANVGDLETLGRKVADAKAAVRIIAQRGEAARDSSKIYGAVSELAERHGVTLMRLNPGTQRGSGAKKAEGDELQAQSVHFEGAVVGAYEQVAAFLGAVDDTQGFVRPVSLNLMPRHQDMQELVEAQFAFEMLRFPVPESLQAFAEASS